MTEHAITLKNELTRQAINLFVTLHDYNLENRHPFERWKRIEKTINMAANRYRRRYNKFENTGD